MNELDKVSEDLKEAKASYDTAEHNLAVARANLTRAERSADSIWRGMTTVTNGDGA